HPMLGVEHAIGCVPESDQSEALLARPAPDNLTVVGESVRPRLKLTRGDCWLVRVDLDQMLRDLRDHRIAYPVAPPSGRSDHVKPVGPEFAPIEDAIPNAFDVTAVEMSTAARRAGGLCFEVGKVGHLRRGGELATARPLRAPEAAATLACGHVCHHRSIVARSRVAAWTPLRTNGTLSRHGKTNQPRPAYCKAASSAVMCQDACGS